LEGIACIACTIIIYCTGGVPGATFNGLGPGKPCQKSPKEYNKRLFSFTAFCNTTIIFLIITGDRGVIPPEILKIEMLCGGI